MADEHRIRPSRPKPGTRLALWLSGSTLSLLSAYIALYFWLSAGMLFVDGPIRFRLRTFSRPLLARVFEPAARAEEILTGTAVRTTDTAAYFGPMNAQTAQGAAMK